MLPAVTNWPSRNVEALIESRRGTGACQTASKRTHEFCLVAVSVVVLDAGNGFEEIDIGVVSVGAVAFVAGHLAQDPELAEPLECFVRCR